MKSNIGWLIKKANTTQVKVSKEMGISQATLNKWALGKSYPPFDKAVQLVTVLKCSIKDLYSINWEEIEMKNKSFEEMCVDKEVIPDIDGAFKDSENGTKVHFDFGEGKPKYDFIYGDGKLIPVDEEK